MAPKMPPLTAWDCDTCGRLIEDAAEGQVVFPKDSTRADVLGQYQIVHTGTCDADSSGKETNAFNLPYLLGDDGRNVWLTFLTDGPFQDSRPRTGQPSGWAEGFSRTQIPHYEEARRYFRRQSVLETFHDARMGVLSQETLLRIIEIGHSDGQ